MNLTSLKYLLIFSTLLFLGGCATASPIMEADKLQSQFSDAVYKGTKIIVSENKEGLTEYRVFQHGDNGFVSLNDVRSGAEGRANRFCEQRRMAYRVLEEQTSIPPHILGNFPRVELVFVCEEASKSKSSNSAEAYEQLERLGNLLEKGLITKEEFNTEKSKLFKKTAM